MYKHRLQTQNKNLNSHFKGNEGKTLQIWTNQN